VAIYKEEALPAPKALNVSSLNILAQKSSPKLRMNQFQVSARPQSVVGITRLCPPAAKPSR
jgi:hypothetical protein